MVAIRNGFIPTDLLTVIPGTSRHVRVEVLPQTVALRAAFYTEFNKPLVITDAYRNFADQVDVKNRKGFLAATPGKSNHGWGLAIDFGSRVNIFGTDEYRWMKANGPRFGWYHPVWAEPDGFKPEAWHWETRITPVPVSNYVAIPGVNIPTPRGSVPAALEPEDELSAEDVAAINGRLDAITKTLAEQVGPDTAFTRQVSVDTKAWVADVGTRIDVTKDWVGTVADEARANGVRLDILTRALDAALSAGSSGVTAAQIRQIADDAVARATITITPNGA
jgi:hypothetical protein